LLDTSQLTNTIYSHFTVYNVVALALAVKEVGIQFISSGTFAPI